MFSWYCLSDPIYLLYSFKLSKNSLFALAVKANFSYFKLKHDMSVSLFSPFFWHERQRCSQSPFKLSTGNNVSGQLFPPLFSSFLLLCSQRMLFSYNGSLNEKVSLVKVARSRPKPRNQLMGVGVGGESKIFNFF